MRIVKDIRPGELLPSKLQRLQLRRRIPLLQLLQTDRGIPRGHSQGQDLAAPINPIQQRKDNIRQCRGRTCSRLPYTALRIEGVLQIRTDEERRQLHGAQELRQMRS